MSAGPDLFLLQSIISDEILVVYTFTKTFKALEKPLPMKLYYLPVGIA